MLRIFILILGVATTAYAQVEIAELAPLVPAKTGTARAMAVAASGTETLRFKSEVDLEPKSTDQILFKYDDDSKAQTSDDVIADKTSFNAYPGYPKHRVLASYLPTQVRSTWSYSGQEYNFNNNSSSSFGLGYEYLSNPTTRFGFEYSRYSLAVKAAAVTPYTITASDVTIDQYTFKSQFCQVLQSSFFQQFCYGANIGVESYPLLDFISSSALSLSKVQDMILGLHIAYHHPLYESVLLKSMLGYNYGTGGAGSTGELTSQSNNALYVKVELEKMLNEHNGFLIGLQYNQRHATVKGKRGSNDDEWKSTVTTVAGNATYIYEF